MELGAVPWGKAALLRSFSEISKTPHWQGGDFGQVPQEGGLEQDSLGSQTPVLLLAGSEQGSVPSGLPWWGHLGTETGLIPGLRDCPTSQTPAGAGQGRTRTREPGNPGVGKDL